MSSQINPSAQPSGRTKGIREVERGREGRVQEGRRASSRSSSCESERSTVVRAPRQRTPESDDEDPVPGSQVSTTESTSSFVRPATGFGSYASFGFGKFASSATRSSLGGQGSLTGAFGVGLPRSQTSPVAPAQTDSTLKSLGFSAQPKLPSASASRERSQPLPPSQPTRSPSPEQQIPMAGESLDSQTSQCSTPTVIRSTSNSVADLRSPSMSSSTEKIVSAYTFNVTHPSAGTTKFHESPRPTEPVAEADQSGARHVTKQPAQKSQQPLSIHNFRPTPITYPASSHSKALPATQPLTRQPPLLPPLSTSTVVQRPEQVPADQPKAKSKRRKRGEWRVENYQHNPRDASPSAPNITHPQQAPSVCILKRGESERARLVPAQGRLPPPPSHGGYHYPTPQQYDHESFHDDYNPSRQGVPSHQAVHGVPRGAQQSPRYNDSHQVPLLAHPLPPGKPPMLSPSASGSGNFQTVEIVIEDERNGEELVIEDDFTLECGPGGVQRMDIRRLGDVLQSGPSRRDGPAKVYTLRNGRKQFIVEVTEDNVDKFASGKVQVPLDLTLKLFVETPAPKQSSLAQSLPPHSLTTPNLPNTGSLPQLASPAASEHPTSPGSSHLTLMQKKRSHLQVDANAAELVSTEDTSMSKRQKVRDELDAPTP